MAETYCHINQSDPSVQYLTDIPRQREEYEVPYHFYSSSWSGICVLLHDKSKLLLSHNKTNNPTQLRTNKTWPKWAVPYVLLSLTGPRLVLANNLYSLVSFVVVAVMTVDNKNNLSTHRLLPTTVVQLFLLRL